MTTGWTWHITGADSGGVGGGVGLFSCRSDIRFVGG